MDARLPAVLVVDDDLEFAGLYSCLLAGSFEVRLAFDGVDAMEELDEDPPDAVLLDLRLPRASGAEVLEHMLRDSRLKDIPVVVATGIAEDERVEALWGLPDVFAVMSKLLPPSVVAAELQRAVDICRHRRACRGRASVESLKKAL